MTGLIKKTDGRSVGAQIGLGLGDNAGILIEELSDIITEDKTDFTLRRQKAALTKRIIELKEKIANDLQPAVDRARDIVSVALENYRNCRAGG